MVLAWPNISALNYWENLPQIADVPYTWVRTNGGPPGNITLSSVITSPIRVREKQVSFGVYKWAETTFKIDPGVWDAYFEGDPNGVYPKIRDSITDAAGNVWTVRSVAPPDDSQSPWRLGCLRLIVEATLCDTISIEKPIDTTDAYLSPLTAQGAPSGPETDIPCRIQFEREEVEDFQGVQFFRGYYSIYVQNLDDNLAIGTVVTARAGAYNGTTFRVISNDNIEQIEELEVLTVTIDPVA